MAVTATGLFSNQGSGTSSATSASVSPTANATLVLFAWNYASGTTAAAAPTITQSGITVPNGWTQLATGTMNTGGTANDTRWTIFYALLGASPGTGTFTATWGAAQTGAFLRGFTLAGEIQTGTNGANAFPVGNAGITSSGSASSFSYSMPNALVDANSLVLVSSMIQGLATFTAGTGFTAYGTSNDGARDLAGERGNNVTTVAGSWTGGPLGYGAVALEIADAGGGATAYSLTASPGSFAITGSPSTFPTTSQEGWTNTVETAYGSTEVHEIALPGDRLGRAYYDGANIKFLIHTLGVGDGTPVTVDSTAGDNDVMLNQPLAYDPTVGAYGRIFLCYGRNIDSGSKGVLCIKTSDDFGATWSAEHVIDDGTAHATTNSFYRVGCWAYNGVVSVHYSYDSNSTFHTDGIWRAVGTYTGLGSVSWGATGLVYSTTGGQYEPNVKGAADGTVIVSWYDDGTNTNSAGDLYTVKSTDHGQTWPGAATKQTTSTDFGRPRIATNGCGIWWIIANKPWGGSAAAVYTLTSTDNGVTWGTPIQRWRAGASYSLDHPAIAMRGDFIGLIWRGQTGDVGSTGHGFIYSRDGGNTWSTPTNPFADATTSDAPQLMVTSSYLVATGYDQATSKTMQTQTTQFFAVAATANRVFTVANRRVGPMALRNKFRQPYWPQAAVAAGGPTAYTITATGATFAITGSQTTLPVGRNIISTAGGYAVTGDAVTTPVGRKLSASPGSYSITGDATTLPVGRRLNVSPGSYSITGDPTTLPVGRRLAINPGVYTIAGFQVTFIAPGQTAVAGTVTTTAAPFAQVALTDLTAATVTLKDSLG